MRMIKTWNMLPREVADYCLYSRGTQIMPTLICFNFWFALKIIEKITEKIFVIYFCKNLILQRIKTISKSKQRRRLTEHLITILKVTIYFEKYVKKSIALIYIYENKFRTCQNKWVPIGKQRKKMLKRTYISSS